MRDYSNMPVLNWQGTITAKKAMAQVHHEEPVIIQFPVDINLAVDSVGCDCDTGRNPGQQINCSVSSTLKTLADNNDLPELLELAGIAHEAGQVIDIEAERHRIIIHD